jgi:hypothetical protein
VIVKIVELSNELSRWKPRDIEEICVAIGWLQKLLHEIQTLNQAEYHDSSIAWS